jgi:hypothetical protein
MNHPSQVEHHEFGQGAAGSHPPGISLLGETLPAITQGAGLAAGVTTDTFGHLLLEVIPASFDIATLEFLDHGALNEIIIDFFPDNNVRYRRKRVFTCQAGISQQAFLCQLGFCAFIVNNADFCGLFLGFNNFGSLDTALQLVVINNSAAGQPDYGDIGSRNLVLVAGDDQIASVTPFDRYANLRKRFFFSLGRWEKIPGQVYGQIVATETVPYQSVHLVFASDETRCCCSRQASLFIANKKVDASFIE